MSLLLKVFWQSPGIRLDGSPTGSGSACLAFWLAGSEAKLWKLYETRSWGNPDFPLQEHTTPIFIHLGEKNLDTSFHSSRSMIDLESWMEVLPKTLWQGHETIFPALWEALDIQYLYLSSFFYPPTLYEKTKEAVYKILPEAVYKILICTKYWNSNISVCIYDV